MTPWNWVWRLFLAILLAGQGTVALEIDENQPDSVKKAAASVAGDLMDMYHKDIDKTGIIGKLDGTWWIGGAIFMTMMEYWHYTGDETYNSDVTDGMLAQKGKYNDYFPSNWSTWLGNDDQIFWGLASITAAELNYPERDGQPSWVALAQGVFNNQVGRWDGEHCGGGMRWQCWPYQDGYNLKNSVSNGGLFQLAARLLYYTGNETYSEWANKIWDFSASSPLINEKNWNVADSTHNSDNCTTGSNIQWTYNYGMYISGSAYMYNHTDGKEEKWKKRVDGLLHTAFREFFPHQYGGNTMSEYNCEVHLICDNNSAFFKGVTLGWLTTMTTLISETAQEMIPKIKATAAAAAQQCSGGSNGRMCGSRWYQKKWDGTQGIGQEASSLTALISSLVGEKGGAPKSRNTGGISKPNPNAGTANHDDEDPTKLKPITTGDKAGAGILTVLFHPYDYLVICAPLAMWFHNSVILNHLASCELFCSVYHNQIENAYVFVDQFKREHNKDLHNQTYAEWAETVFDWTASVPLMDNQTWNVGDSVQIADDCKHLGNDQWSYNYGNCLMGAAFMQNYTNGTESKWKDAVDGLLGVTLDRFFPKEFGGNVLSEFLCEPLEVCDNNQILFKGYVANCWLLLLNWSRRPETESSLSSWTQPSHLVKRALAWATTHVLFDGTRNGTDGMEWRKKSVPPVAFLHLYLLT
ncbi:hydrolase family 76 protein [Aspergillus sclerotialis]|uniref:mannan endo-1,6-alpha-mannosidase n=1 Tax=Aspergillus sclerotialis TaxID=2070753 RepID=A0A3A2Z815_9EURO|nr:hydrolase family 76 protein [Aspergillus sclerotialis]